MGVQIDGLDWRKVIRNYSTRETLFYCDPPYHPSTRGRERYVNEMTAEDHRDLLDALKSVAVAVAVSGYPCEEYSDALDDWDLRTWDTHAYSSGRSISRQRGKEARTECLWRNARCVEALEAEAAQPTLFGIGGTA